MLLLPLFVVLAFLTTAAVGVWLAAVNVRYRDVRYITPFLVQIWFFATPVAYASDVVPDKWAPLFHLNPMVGVVDGFRWTVLGVEPSVTCHRHRGGRGARRLCDRAARVRTSGSNLRGRGVMTITNGTTYDDDWSIRVDHVAKRYDLGEREQYRALRDVIARSARRLVAPAPERPDNRHRWALEDVSFRVAPGEVVGLVGRNGAGKSTLLKLISRITRPTRGETAVRGRIGTLLEVGSGFHPELTGAENIYLNGAILGMRHAEIKANFDEIVEFSGIGTYLDTPVKRYSTGMYMRLAFAVAAHLDTEVLLVDEVLAVGDAEFQRKCVGRMRELSQNRGRTVLFVSHNDAAIRQLCPRSIWLEAGAVKMDGQSDVVLPAYLEAQSSQALLDEWIALDDRQRSGSGEIQFREVRLSVPGQRRTASRSRPAIP